MAAPTSVDRRLVEHVDRLAAEHRPIPLEYDDWAARIARVETELLWARDRGLAVPAYVVRAFREALERAAVRPASDFGPSSHVR